MLHSASQEPYLTVDDVASDVLPVGPGDLFNPPALTNFRGCCQAALDLVAVQHVTFAPYSYGDVPLGILLLNGRCPGKSGVIQHHHWRPDRIRREAEWDGYRIVSNAVMPMAAQQVVVEVTITNERSEPRSTEARLRTQGGVIYSRDGWHTPYAPKEAPSISVTPWEGTPPPEQQVHNTRHVLDERSILYCSCTSPAVALHTMAPPADRVEGGDFVFTVDLAPGAGIRLFYLLVLGDDAKAARSQTAIWREAPDAVFERAERDWNEELAAIFTPGNDRYSGSLPRLVTENKALRRIYTTAILSAVYLKREHPDSAYGRTYTTLMPRYWVTTSFINDWSLSAYLLAMLDPTCVRRHVALWLERDIHHHFGTEYASGATAGNWYACNDFAMVRLISAYVRTTGDRAWLDEVVAGRTVLEHVHAMATHYRALDAGHGLADCGDRNSLLECVGRYEHEVASVNAGYVWALRETAALFAHRGDAATADALRRDAGTLVDAIRQLYVPGEGFWHCRRPDGTLVPVRHAWDFVHTFNFLYDDLPPTQRAEMLRFFQDALQTPAWMHALSLSDPDADFSLRPDHQWNGSYPAWVALAACALARAARWADLAAWLPGLAQSANQGPYSQAHFVEAAAPLLEGGARKAPTEWPYINDWMILAAGSFYELVLLHLFGLAFGLEDLTAAPNLHAIAPQAVLDGLLYRGTTYRVSADGLTRC